MLKMNAKSVRKGFALSSIVVIATAVGCGKAVSKSASGDVGAEQDAVTVKVQDIGGQTSLALVDADSFSGSISGCVSGYAKSDISASTTSLKLARGDKDCVFKLDAFAFNGKNYSMAGGVWTPGSSFVATSGDGSKLRFSVVSNIASVVAGSQTVALSFSALDVGLSQSAGANIGAAVSVSGADPVFLDVSFIDVSVDGTSGAGVFDLKFQCASALVGTGLSAKCGGLEVSKMRFGLVKNTLPAAVTLDDCRAVVTNGGSLSVAAADVVPAGDGSMPNGGVVAPKLRGPAKLFDAANAKLVVAVASSDANGSCKYFPVDISAP